MYKFLLIFCILTIVSCHFHDDRVSLRNNSDLEILAAVCHFDPKEREDILSPFFPIAPGQQRVLKLIRNLDYNFIKDDSVSILIITPEMEQSIKWENGYYEYEKLLETKKYRYLNLPVKDIIPGRIEIDFPNSGFKSH
jgi:hypothetical protein